MGLQKVIEGSDEFKKVSSYFYQSMNNERFKITSIKRYQNQLKFDIYYQNLKNVQAKMKNSNLSFVKTNDYKDYNPVDNDSYNHSDNDSDNHSDNDSDNDSGSDSEIDSNNAFDGQRFLFHVFRYQDLEDILGVKNGESKVTLKDYGFFPSKLAKKEPNIRTVEELNTEVHQPDDICMNLGDNALYFTVNKSETVLYSHSKDNCSDKGEHIQLLCRVITGIEKDYLDDVKKAFGPSKDYKTYQDLREMQRPYFQRDENIEVKAKNETIDDYDFKVNWADSHMYD